MLRIYALHPTESADIDVGVDVPIAAGFLFVPARLNDEIFSAWRNRARPLLVVVQDELSDTFREGAEVWTWRGGPRVSCMRIGRWVAMGDRIVGDFDADWGRKVGRLALGPDGGWAIEWDPSVGDERRLLAHRCRRRALRALAGNGPAA